jgi:myo-inositol-1-phosphate synthase
MDGIGKYLKPVVKISSEPDVASVSQAVKDAGADILVNYLPVGSTKAVEFYAGEAIKARVPFINAMPVFIASNSIWQQKFVEAGLPTAGDDVMSQLGATVLHKTIVKLCVDRGVKVDETYQLNIGGDADFLNMLEEGRLVDKRISKTSAVRAMSPYEVPTRIGPSDYVPFLDNDKVCYVWLKGRYFGNIPLTLDLKLHVIDAYDSAGVMVDAIRGTKVAFDRGVSGPLESISAYCFKHPPMQMPYTQAKQAFMEFVEGKRER